MSRSEVVEAISAAVGLPRRHVAQVVDELEKLLLRTVLKSGERITLPGFGMFYRLMTQPRAMPGGGVSVPRGMLRFRQSRRLAMDKLGVVLDDDKTKTGAAVKTCPGCGAALPRPNYCNTCGTEPFEKRPEPKK